jgi:hypothetical protein
MGQSRMAGRPLRGNALRRPTRTIGPTSLTLAVADSAPSATHSDPRRGAIPSGLRQVSEPAP